MDVRYSQVVCPFCYTPISHVSLAGDSVDRYYCQWHGFIEARLTTLMQCRVIDGHVVLPAYAVEIVKEIV